MDGFLLNICRRAQKKDLGQSEPRSLRNYVKLHSFGVVLLNMIIEKA